MSVGILSFANRVKATSTESAPSTNAHVGMKRERSFDLNKELTPEDSEEAFTSPAQLQTVQSEKTRRYRRRKQVQLSYATEKDKCDHDRRCLHWSTLTMKERKAASDRKRYHSKSNEEIDERNRRRNLKNSMLTEEEKRRKYDINNAYRKKKRLAMTDEEHAEARRKEAERSQRRRDARIVTHTAGVKRQRSFDLNREVTPEDQEEAQDVKEGELISKRPHKEGKQIILSYAIEKDKCDHGRTCLHWNDLSYKERKAAHDKRRYHSQTKEEIEEKKRERIVPRKRLLSEEKKRRKQEMNNISRKKRRLAMTVEERAKERRREAERSQSRRDARKLLALTQNTQAKGKNQ
ncbi:uncharacterized protein FA14DRAFT_156325 [Meira miltonrushii]|uniref:Uncharacterized protein n=1 Tax=Meira miltonrushii TaxID=1280837 RepID=A0A316V9C1_9BASI|nr:uncharacterized protein FA14DRAFT_156325 [Meira miltonrushii]PWN33638.1 hypothetical protein FA14DRAFT_156325 [Meira miltonrushii]